MIVMLLLRRMDAMTQKTKDRIFYHLLGNTMVASVINYTVWFAITFFAYLQTKSVFVTGIIAGVFLIATAGSGIWFGSLVDHYKKKGVMLLSSLVSLLAYVISLGIYLGVGAEGFKDPA